MLAQVKTLTKFVCNPALRALNAKIGAIVEAPKDRRAR